MIQDIGMNSVPVEFKYDHDFDHNGTLFYLGTLGYQAHWQNPDIVRKQIRTFASSVDQGRPSDIVGRRSVNCMTHQQPFSFMGF
jgi:hypothetical protein